MSGTNYGLNDNLQYLEYYFDSLDAKNAKSGAASTDWPEFEMSRPLTNVAAVKILEVQIPFTYFVINTSNNTFVLTETNGAVTQTVTLPVGNYTASTITSELMTDLNAASVLGGNSFTYIVSYNQSTQQLSITKNGAGTFSLVFGPTNDTGFTNPRLWLGYNGGANASTGNTLVAPNVLQITGPNYLYVSSYALGNLCTSYLPFTTYGSTPQTQTINGGGGTGPEMAKIPVNVNPGGIIEWQDPDPQKWFDLENLTNFAFVDFFLGFGNSPFPKPLSLNGAGFSLKLGILVNSMSHNDVQSGLQSQDRIVKRIRPY